MNPYEVLGLPKNYTLDQLREKYKAIAIKVHPDKPGGSDYLFKLVTAAYKELAKTHAARTIDRQFNELKLDSKKGKEVMPSQKDNQSFNLNRFNNVFESNRMPDDSDHGYKEWMSTSADSSSGPAVPKKLVKKFSIDRFNKTFDDLPTHAHASKSMTKFKEPAPLTASSSKLICSELGVEKISDYSGDVSNGGLTFTDYKKAHTTTRLITQDMLKNCDQRELSLDTIEKERGNVRYTMNDTEKDAYEAQLKYHETQEKKRQDEVRKRDRLIEQQYTRMNNLLHH